MAKSLCENCKLTNKPQLCSPYDIDKKGNVIKCYTYQSKNVIRSIINFIKKNENNN